MEINLTADIEQALVAQAKERGMTVEELALETLRQHFVHPAKPDISVDNYANLVDFWSDSLGVLHSKEHVTEGAALSENTGDAFLKILLEKRAQGRL